MTVDGVCFGCQRPNASVRGADGELYHSDCRRAAGQETYFTATGPRRPTP